MLPAHFASLSVNSKKGFTLIELMVVIAIIAILSVVGVVAYRGVTAAARDAKRKADLDAISKAYEVNVSNGNYVPLQDSFFASGVPKPPEGGDHYPCLIGPDSYCTVPSTTTYAYGVTLGSGNTSACPASSSSCYTVASSGSGSFPTLPGSSNPSCDPYGVLTSGLVGYWKMDEGSSPFTDSTINNNSGSWNGGLSSVAGKFGNAGQFNGGYVNIPYNTALDTGTNSSFTMSLWFKTAGTVSSEQEMLSNGADSPIRRKTLYFRSNRTLEFEFWSNNSNANVNTGTTTYYDDGQWHHVVGVRDVNEDKIYIIVDGGAFKKSTNDNTTGSPANSNVWRIGSYFTGGNFFNGMIDDVRIYNRVLSGPEISALYNGCVP